MLGLRGPASIEVTLFDKYSNTLQFVFLGADADANYRATMAKPAADVRAILHVQGASPPSNNGSAPAPAKSSNTTAIALGAALGGVVLLALVVVCVMRSRHEKEARHLRIDSREYMLNTQRQLYPGEDGQESAVASDTEGAGAYKAM